MSTFNGIVKEFPDIRIDHFRLSVETSRPPLAYFLSHVHSDHLEGLETCKSPFIYCSPATKEILLRLERYPHRMNFAKGILETRKQTYKHLRKLLKTIPLETPTVLDLAPGRSVQITLFDANHCVGAVMFLIEGDGKVILYTGDIRSELWWVNNLARHPLMLAYSFNGGKTSLKRLDCIYLDTTFANKQNPYKHFPSKAEGILELLQKVSKYPKDTVFYFNTWTVGYEDVWMALCSFLGCQVHLDNYRYRLYRALATGDGIKAEEAARLFGYNCGNHLQEGCLTERQTRLHSCEQGTGCEVFKTNFVRITPIISRHEGVEMAELGAGGGKGDLDQQHELEVGDAGALGMLMSLCATKMQNQPKLLSNVMEMLASIMRDPVRVIALDSAAVHSEQRVYNQDDFAELEHMPLDSLVPILASLAAKRRERKDGDAMSLFTEQEANATERSAALPTQITFPYSRHSSYTELCQLIEEFKPRDIWPCTVDKAKWSAAQSMSFLFGHIYDTPCKFTHDQDMFRKMGSVPAILPDSGSGTADGRVEGSATSGRVVGGRRSELKSGRVNSSTAGSFSHGTTTAPVSSRQPAVSLHDGERKVASTAPVANDPTRKRRRSDESEINDEISSTLPADMSTAHIDDQPSRCSRVTSEASRILLSSDEYSEAWKQQAFDAALGTTSADWNDIILVSVAGHQEREQEL